MSTLADSKLPVAIRDRLVLLNGKFTLPDESKAAMDTVRTIFDEAGAKLAALFSGGSGLKYDIGRSIHAIDQMQAAKDTACVAFLLPYASTDPRLKPASAS
jgi:hypothetical protein